MATQGLKLLQRYVGEALQSMQGHDEIEAVWVANLALKKIEKAEGGSKPIVKIGCLATLKQMASAQLRGRFQPEGDTEKNYQHSLFPMLQTYYPRMHKADQDPRYIKLELLGGEDIVYNRDRLFRESETKAKHARALEAYGTEKGLLPVGKRKARRSKK